MRYGIEGRKVLRNEECEQSLKITHLNLPKKKSQMRPVRKKWYFLCDSWKQYKTFPVKSSAVLNFFHSNLVLSTHTFCAKIIQLQEFSGIPFW